MQTTKQTIYDTTYERELRYLTYTLAETDHKIEVNFNNYWIMVKQAKKVTLRRQKVAALDAAMRSRCAWLAQKGVRRRLQARFETLTATKYPCG
jgi:site-specific recombinase XerC